ncbi:hypothetical protein GCM10027059_42340 [Myceligenerans halotolerans]
MTVTPLSQALEAGVALIDGSPTPTGNHTGAGTTNFNGKHRKQALNTQVAAQLNGALAAVSVPVRGSRHDSRALEEVGCPPQAVEDPVHQRPRPPDRTTKRGPPDHQP